MRQVFLCFAVFCSFLIGVQAQGTFKLTPFDSVFYLRFGISIATSGDYVIVGTYEGESAYIYKNTGGNWVLDAKVQPSGNDTLTRFGWTVAMDGDYAVIGAPGDDDKGLAAGAAYVFEKTSSGWTELAKLVAPDALAGQHFGSSVAISGNRIVVGKPNESDGVRNAGAAYLFERAGANFQFKFKQTPGGEVVVGLGASVEVSGNYAIASGGYSFSSTPSSHFIYFIDSTHWEMQAILDLNGDSDLDGDYAVFGDRLDDDLGANAGAAYIYQRNGNSWSLVAKLLASDGQAFDEFGASVSILGDHVVVGSRKHNPGVGPAGGAAYVFKRVGSNWIEVSKLTAPDAKSYDSFGNSVALDAKRFVIGSIYCDGSYLLSGAVYVFEPGITAELSVKPEENTDCTPDSNATVLPGFFFKLSTANETFERFSLLSAPLPVFLPEGTASLEISPPNDLWSVCEYEDQLLIPIGTDSLNLLFVAQPVLQCPFLTIDVSFPFMRRCFTSNVYVQYCNTGTVATDSALIQLVLPPGLQFHSGTVPLLAQYGDTLMFDLGVVEKSQCGSFVLEVNVSCDLELGEIRCLMAKPIQDLTCLVPTHQPEASDIVECREVVGSCDPNDKAGFPFEPGDRQYVRKNKELKYQIRFQNVGTDTAFTVVILDTISAQLDLSTLRLGATSHPVEVSIGEGRTLGFVFKDIQLPDNKVNEPGSNGFVNYFISQNKDLPDGTLIENRAAIYFDFNLPVITNDVVHTVGIRPISVKERLSFRISPNPSASGGKIHLELPEPQPGRCTIHDLRGRQITSFDFDGLDFALPELSLASGVYLVKVVVGSGNWAVRQWVIQR